MTISNPSVLAMMSTEDRQLGTIGVIERSQNERITYVNGILNTIEDCALSAIEISCSNGFNKVHFLYDPSQGFLRDVYIAFNLMRSGQPNDSVYKLIQLWRSLFQEMGGENNPQSKIIHYAHSRGGLVTEVALRHLTENERNRVIVYSFGSPAMLNENDFPEAQNILNSKDGVPLANPKRWWQKIGIHSYSNNDQVLESNKFLEHSFLDPSYSSKLKKIGEHFVDRHAV